MPEFRTWLLGYLLSVGFSFLVLGGLTYALARRRGEKAAVWWGIFGGAVPLITLVVLLVRSRPNVERAADQPARRPLAWLGGVALALAFLLPIYSRFVADLAEQWAGEGRALSGAAIFHVQLSNWQARYGVFLHGLWAAAAAALVTWHPKSDPTRHQPVVGQFEDPRVSGG